MPPLRAGHLYGGALGTPGRAVEDICCKTSSSAIASISTSAPEGSAATSTVERAGGASPTWRGVDLVHPREVAEIVRKTVVLTSRSRPLPASSRIALRFCIDLLGLLGDPLDQLLCRRAAARAGRRRRRGRPPSIAWLYGAPWNGAGARSVRTTPSLPRVSFVLERGRDAAASATPSALKIASSTCCVSVAVDQPDVQGSPAASASSSRKRATRSPRAADARLREVDVRRRAAAGPRPRARRARAPRRPARTPSRGPRTPSVRRRSASASPSARPAAATSASRVARRRPRARARSRRCARAGRAGGRARACRWRRSAPATGRDPGAHACESSRPRGCNPRRTQTRSPPGGALLGVDALDRGAERRAGARRSARSRGRSRRRCRSSRCPRRRAPRSASPCRRGCPGSSAARRRAGPGR